jgi:2-phospho-L-lactate/phosphoenolpyruvate guanylyltransferase
VSERIIAIIPIRSFRDGKTRLAPTLGPEAREDLLRRVAAEVVDAAKRSGTIETILIVSPSAEVLDWASELGPEVVALPQSERYAGLNGAIDAGRDWALDAGATAVLSLFADLPHLAPRDLQELTARPEALILGPDRHGEGTNALLLRLAGPGARYRFAFGEGSFAQHLAEARRLGLTVAVHEAPGIGFDLDTPCDWADLLSAKDHTATQCELLLAECGAGPG